MSSHFVFNNPNTDVLDKFSFMVHEYVTLAKPHITYYRNKWITDVYVDYDPKNWNGLASVHVVLCAIYNLSLCSDAPQYTTAKILF